MKSRIIIFANPLSGRGRGRALADRLAQALPIAGCAVTLVTDRPTRELVASLPLENAAVVSIGGDGSLRAVVDGLLARPAPPPPVLVLPMGTANLMGRHLGIRWAASQVVAGVLATLRERRIVWFDAGRANGEVFLLVAGAGIDGQVVHLLDAMRSGPIRFASYVLPAAMTLAQYAFAPIRVEADGRLIFDEQPGIVFIGNVKEYGIGLPILTRAEPDDGLLDVCVMPCRDRTQIAELLIGVATGEHALLPGVVYLRAKTVRVTSPQRVPVQLDGDAAGFTPLDVQVLPKAVPLLVPSPGTPGEG